MSLAWESIPQILFDILEIMVAKSEPLFPLGKVVATPAALAALEEAGQSPAEFLDRHVRGCWGDLDPEDWKANEDALRNGERLLSAYVLKTGERLWIITEHDRSVTTCLLPSCY